MAQTPGSTSTQGQLSIRVAGALSGAVFVPNLDASVSTLRQEVARLLGAEPHDVKLIVGGRSLQDDSKTLQACGITPTSRVLVTAGAQAGSELQQAEAKQARLEHVKRMLGKMAARTVDSSDAQSFQLENQRGEAVQLQVSDRKAIVMGLALHDLGRAALAKGEYERALSLLGTAEESFSVADKSLLAGIDNVGMLLLDYVWCCYKLGDARRLAVARERLVRARAALEQAYGAGMMRLRQLHGSTCPEHAVYTRLESLEAVAAYYAGDLDLAEQRLHTARMHWQALQVSDARLAQLGGMGYEPEEARRALKLSGGDIDAAITFITNQRIAQEEQQAKRAKEARWRAQRVKYGRTPKGQYVKEEYRDRLAGLGYDRELAAFLLRLLDNDVDAAVETLLSERAYGLLVQALSAMQQLRAQAESTSSGAASGSSAPPPDNRAARKAYKRLLTAESAAVLAGLFKSMQEPGSASVDEEEIALRLHSTLQELMAAPASRAKRRRPRAAANGRGEGDSAAAAGGGGGRGPQAMDIDAELAAALAADEEEGDPGDHRSDGEKSDSEEDGDAELEQELREAVQSDAMASYDVDVQEEGEIIQTFSALCASARSPAPGPSSSSAPAQ